MFSIFWILAKLNVYIISNHQVGRLAAGLRESLPWFFTWLALWYQPLQPHLGPHYLLCLLSERGQHSEGWDHINIYFFRDIIFIVCFSYYFYDGLYHLQKRKSASTSPCSWKCYWTAPVCVYILCRLQMHFIFFHLAPFPWNVIALPGVVKKKSQNHLGCLVHGCFNVTVLRDDHTGKMEWDGARIEEGDEVKLKLVDIQLRSYMPYFKAELDPERWVGSVT